MEIPINPDSKYRDTFGISQDSLVESLNVNPLDESEYSKVTPKKMNFYSTFEVDEQVNNQKQYQSEQKIDNSRFTANKESSKDPKSFTQNRIFEYNQDEDDQSQFSKSAQKEVQMSFKFQNKVISCIFKLL